MTALTEHAQPAWPKLPLKYGLNRNLAAPNSLAQSAVFSTQYYRSNAPRPEYCEATKLEAMGAVQVYQTAGHRLDQWDADVFYELLRRILAEGREMDRESHVRFQRTELLKAIGRARGGTTRTMLDASLDRLYRADFKIRVPGVFETRSRLILKMHRLGPETSMECDYDVVLDVELARLFDRGQWTLLRRAQRDKLRNNPLARGLHVLYSTLATPYPMLELTVKRLTGRESMKQRSKWFDALTEALELLKEATGWSRCALEYVEKTGHWMVFVEKGLPPKSSSKAKNTNAVALADNGHGDYDDI